MKVRRSCVPQDMQPLRVGGVGSFIRRASSGGGFGSPPEIHTEVPLGQESLDLIDAAVPRPFEVLLPQADCPVRFVELPRALARVPMRPERGQHARDLGEARAVVALVWPGALSEGDLAPWDGLLDDLRDLADAVILIVATDVERLRADCVGWRGEYGEESPGDVLDVHDRAPGRAVALEQHLARGERPGDEVVQDDVEAQTRWHSVRSGAA